MVTYFYPWIFNLYGSFLMMRLSKVPDKISKISPHLAYNVRCWFNISSPAPTHHDAATSILHSSDGVSQSKFHVNLYFVFCDYLLFSQYFCSRFSWFFAFQIPGVQLFLCLIYVVRLELVSHSSSFFSSKAQGSNLRPWGQILSAVHFYVCIPYKYF